MARPKTTNNTFTKRAVRWLLILGTINGMVPFLLSAFNREPCTDMGIAWITEIVAVILGYMCKAFFETKESEKNRIYEERTENQNED
jgi:hypothetical protein